MGGIKRTFWSAVVLTGILLTAAGGSAEQAQPHITVPLAPPPKPVEELIASLDSPNPQERAAAAWDLAGAGRIGAQGVRRLIELLKGPDEDCRNAAVWTLSHLQDDGARAAVVADSHPEVIKITKPRYPTKAFIEMRNGSVKVELLIDEHGRVAHAEIRESMPDFDKAALACAREWTFKPGLRDGKPIPVVAKGPVIFTISPTRP